MAVIKEAFEKIAELKAEIEAKKNYNPSDDEEVVEVIRPEETSIIVPEEE